MIQQAIGSLIRLSLLMAAAISIMALGLGHASPERRPRRVASPPSYQVLGPHVTASHGGGTHLLDVENGRLEPLVLPPGMGLDMSSVSPWEEDGRRQIVGLGWSRSGSGDSSLCSDFGLVRMSLPDGEVLDRWALPEEAVPAGPPCWIPDIPAGVIYAGADGRIYRVDIASTHQDGDDRGLSHTRPRPLTWPVSMAGTGDVFVNDVVWPEDARLGGRVLASLRFKHGETGRYTQDDQIWWLELGRGATSILAGGRLLEPAPANGPIRMRLPNLACGSDGAPALAYLVHRPGESGYQLRVTPIHFDPASGSPRARDPDSRPLAAGCLPNRPVASTDGRWITVVRPAGPGLRAERIAIPGADSPR